jgi:SAM-dependent methyltransferase
MHAYQGNLCDPTDPNPTALAAPEFSNFDIAAVGLGFHHFDDPALAARRLAERLKTGGVLMILDFLPHDKPDVSLAYIPSLVWDWVKRTNRWLTQRYRIGLAPCGLDYYSSRLLPGLDQADLRGGWRRQGLCADRDGGGVSFFEGERD